MESSTCNQIYKQKGTSHDPKNYRIYCIRQANNLWLQTLFAVFIKKLDSWVQFNMVLAVLKEWMNFNVITLTMGETCSEKHQPHLQNLPLNQNQKNEMVNIKRKETNS